MSDNHQSLPDRREINQIILDTLSRVDDKTGKLGEQMASMDTTIKVMQNDIDQLKAKGDDEIGHMHELEMKVGSIQTTCNNLSSKMEVINEVQTKLLGHEKEISAANKERTEIYDSLKELKKSISGNNDRLRKVEKFIDAMETRKKMIAWIANFGKPVIFIVLGALFWIIIEYLQRPK